MEMTRKITASTLTKGVRLNYIKESKYLGRIYGLVRRTEVVTSQYGEVDKFYGEFVAHRSDGREYLSAMSFLPTEVSSVVKRQLGVSPAGGMKFAFDFYAIPSEKSKSGFEWRIESVMEMEPALTTLSGFPDFPRDNQLTPLPDSVLQEK